MPQMTSQFVTISCDGPGCNKTATFPATQQDRAAAGVENPWLDNARFIQQPTTGQVFAYCGDICEVNAVTEGKHNKPEEKKVIEINAGAAALAMKHAKKIMEAKSQSDKALKEGSGITIEG